MDAGNAIALGVAAAGLTLLLRASARFFNQQKPLSSKPLGCNLCMGFWSSLAITAVTTHKTDIVQDTFLHLLVAYGISYALLELSYRPEPPDLTQE